LSKVINPAETDFDNFRSDYLGKYEAICEMALAIETGAWVGLIDEKNKRKKLVKLSL
jgi:predicted nucleic acid-binding protein